MKQEPILPPKDPKEVQADAETGKPEKIMFLCPEGDGEEKTLDYCKEWCGQFKTCDAVNV